MTHLNGPSQTDYRHRLGCRRCACAGPCHASSCSPPRSILIIIWHLLNDPTARYRDLGADWHQRKTSRDKKIRGRQLQALGLEVTVTDAAA
jgi:hypothetical protein